MSYEDLSMDHYTKEKIMDKLEDARGECRIMAAKLSDAAAENRCSCPCLSLSPVRVGLTLRPSSPLSLPRDLHRELQAERIANIDLEQKVSLAQKRATQAESGLQDLSKSSPAQRSIHLIEEQIQNEKVWTQEMVLLQGTIEPLQQQLEDAAAQRYSLQGYLKEAKQQAVEAQTELTAAVARERARCAEEVIEAKQALMRSELESEQTQHDMEDDLRRARAAGEEAVRRLSQYETVSEERKTNAEGRASEAEIRVLQLEGELRETKRNAERATLGAEANVESMRRQMRDLEASKRLEDRIREAEQARSRELEAKLDTSKSLLTAADRRVLEVTVQAGKISTSMANKATVALGVVESKMRIEEEKSSRLEAMFIAAYQAAMPTGGSRLPLNRQMEELRDMLVVDRQERAGLSAELRGTLLDMTASHEAEVDSLKAGHEAEMALVEQHRGARAGLDSAALGSPPSASTMHEMEKMRMLHEDEIDRLKEKHAGDLEDLRQAITPAPGRREREANQHTMNTPTAMASGGASPFSPEALAHAKSSTLGGGSGGSRSSSPVANSRSSGGEEQMSAQAFLRWLDSRKSAFGPQGMPPDVEKVLESLSNEWWSTQATPRRDIEPSMPRVCACVCVCVCAKLPLSFPLLFRSVSPRSNIRQNWSPRPWNRC